MEHSDDVVINISNACKKKYEEDSLRAYITERLKTDYENSSDVNKKAYLYYLLRIDITDERKFQRVIFAYNDGNLRSYEELAIYDKQHKHYFIFSHFNIIRHLINLFFILTPFGIMMKKTLKVDNILLIPFGLLLSLILAYIGSLIGCTININLADSCGIAETDGMVAKEKFKRKVGIYSGIFSFFSISHHAKKSIKDIADVDSWKKFN